jgi:hypothetical protein
MYQSGLEEIFNRVFIFHTRFRKAAEMKSAAFFVLCMDKIIALKYGDRHVQIKASALSVFSRSMWVVGGKSGDAGRFPGWNWYKPTGGRS